MDRAKQLQSVFCCDVVWQVAVPTGGSTMWICPLCEKVTPVMATAVQVDPRQAHTQDDREAKPL